MRAFITGISGFAGSFLAEHLLSCNDRVLGSSQTGQWRDDVPGLLTRQAKVIAWDICQPISKEAQRQIVEFAPQWIFHLAAISVPADCGEDKPTPQAMATNVMGTRHVLQLASSLPCRGRLLLASSCYVYSAVNFDDPFVDENAPTDPASGYGKTKLAAEQEMAQAQQQGVEGIVARVFQHTGTRQSPRMIVPQWVEQFTGTAQQPIEVKSLQTQLDLTDVRDVVRAYRALAEQGRCGSVYNVGSGVNLCSRDIFEQLRQMVDPSREVVELAPSRNQHPIADITRITQQTRWQPEIPLKTTLADILAFWKRRQSA